MKAKHILLWFVMIFLMSSSYVRAQFTETEIKAAFLERFTRFVEWPSQPGLNFDSSAFVIGIVNGNLMKKEIAELYKTQTIKGKPVKIKYISSRDSLDTIQSCHLIFITEKWKKEVGSIIKKINRKPILTVGDSDKFSEQGVMINFYKSGGRIRFEINSDSVRHSGLSMDFRLLEFAAPKKKRGQS
jgi:hypothetical protein